MTGIASDARPYQHSTPVFVRLSILLLFSLLFQMGRGLAIPSRSAQAAAPPNIVLILLDDLDADSVVLLPKISSLLAAEGMSFSQFFVTTPSCCPSRSSILRGQYAHNHGVWSNDLKHGGFATFRRRGDEKSTVATWLHDAGYRTGLFGKYLNGYERSPSHVPPGWDRWYAWAGKGKFFNYQLSKNGQLVEFGHRARDYETDVLGREARDLIRDAAVVGDPFFIYLSPHAPHTPAKPAPRHREAFDGLSAPRLPSFNEDDLSDKPEYIRKGSLFSDREIRQIDKLYEKRLRSMLSVDDLVEDLMDTLNTTDTQNNTYIFLTSDNGFLLGQHRRAEGKGSPYEEAIRVPLMVWGPAVPSNTHVAELALNIDLAPTFADLAGLTPPDFVDGRSLRPFLDSQTPNWRHSALVERLVGSERHHDDEGDSGVVGHPAPIPKFVGLRTETYVYVEYGTGEVELYDLTTDPYELANLAATADPGLLSQLSDRVGALRDCAAESCRATEDLPVPQI